MAYRHVNRDGAPIPLPLGKIVCVGRNYVEHIRELNNPVPSTPLLFMKPATALVGLDDPLVLPTGQGRCHHEVELAVLIGRELRRADAETCRGAVAGYAVALDLTLRDLQDELKRQGHPWERAKAFDGSCPLSPFIWPTDLPDPQNAELSLRVNGVERQRGNTRLMMVGVFDLLAVVSATFTLWPGDVVLTGTPAGVGELHPGDRLRLTLGPFSFGARVAGDR